MKKLFTIAACLISLTYTEMPLKAQTIPFTFAGTSPVAFQMDSNGLLSSIGTYGIGTLSLSGGGTRMIWYPGKGAFRAGNVTTTGWDDANIGSYSVALGQDVMASGYCSVAFGQWGGASGQNSTEMGVANAASGTTSMAMGSWGVASGTYSTSMGQLSAAVGITSLSTGDATAAFGTNSSSFGESTVAASYDSFVLGIWNVGGGNATSWVAADPLFEIGNGTVTNRSDALVVYKNGNVTAQGTITAAPAGDIPMYTGN